MIIPFIKMNGAGNDFVIIDARQSPILLSYEQVRAFASRNNPITQGADQVIVIEPSHNADIFMRIYNADGSEVDACGNATRCIASLWMQDNRKSAVAIETNAGMLSGNIDNGMVWVDMGKPRLLWDEIPLAIKVDTLRVPMLVMEACCVSMGNPHAVFFMDILPSDAEVARMGHELEHNREIFPEGVNVTFAKMISPIHIEAKVWERGAGMTKACGTGACATFVAAMRLNLTSNRRSGVVHYPGGVLNVEWKEDGHVLLGGEIVREFEGSIDV